MRKKLEAMDAELRKTRATQTALITELEMTQARLLKTREEDASREQIKKALDKSNTSLHHVHRELEQIELKAINKERSFQRQLDHVLQDQGELKIAVDEKSKLLESQTTELAKREQELSRLQKEIAEAQATRNDQLEKIAAMEAKLKQEMQRSAIIKDGHQERSRTETSQTAENMALLESEKVKLLAINRQQTEALASLKKELAKGEIGQEKVRELIEQNARLADDNKRLMLSQQTLRRKAQADEQNALATKLAEAKTKYQEETTRLLQKLDAHHLDEPRIKQLIAENIELVAHNQTLKQNSSAPSKEKASPVAPKTADNQKKRNQQLRELIHQNVRLTEENRTLTLERENVATQMESDRLNALTTELTALRKREDHARNQLEKERAEKGLQEKQIGDLINKNMNLASQNKLLVEQTTSDKGHQLLSEARKKQAETRKQLDKELELRAQQETEIAFLKQKNLQLINENEQLIAAKNQEIKGISKKLSEQKNLTQQREVQLANLKGDLETELKEVERLEQMVAADAKMKEDRTAQLLMVERRITQLQSNLTTLQNQRDNPNAPIEKIVELEKRLSKEKDMRASFAEDLKRSQEILNGNNQLIEAQKKQITRLQTSMTGLASDLQNEGSEIAKLKGELQKAIEEKQKIQVALEKKAAEQASTLSAEQRMATSKLQKQIVEQEMSLKKRDEKLTQLTEKLKRQQLETMALKTDQQASDELATSLAAEKARAKQLEEMKSKMDRDLSDLKTQLDNERTRREELEALAKKHQALRSEIHGLNDFLTKTQEDNQIQVENMRAISIERDSLKQLISDYEGTIRNKKTENGSAKKPVGPKSTPPPSTQVKTPDMVSKPTTLQKSDETHLQAVKVLNEKLSRHQAILVKVQQEKSATDKKLIERENELAQQKRNLATLEQALAQQAEKERGVKEQTALLDSLREKLKTKEMALLSLEREAADTKTNLPTPEQTTERNKKLAELTNERNKLKSSIDERDDVIRTLRSALTDQQKQLKSFKESKANIPAPSPTIPPRSTPPTTTKPDNAATTKKIEPITKQPTPELKDVPGTTPTIETSPKSPLPTKAEVAVSESTTPEPKAVKTPDRFANRDLVARELSNQAGRKLQDGRIDDAIADFRQSLKYNPESETTRVGLATALYTQGSFPEARQLVERTLEKSSSNPEALGLKSILLREEGNYPSARQHIDKAIALKPNDPLLLNYLGIIAHSQGDRAEAITAFSRAIEYDRMHAEARFNLAVLLATENRIDEAKEHYEAAQKLGSERDERLEKILYR